VYLACWLILPAEGEDGVGAGPRAIVVLAQAVGALAALGALAAAAGLAALFGFGWVVVALAACVLAGSSSRGRAWAPRGRSCRSGRSSCRRSRSRRAT
jgi:hypothetical protein